MKAQDSREKLLGCLPVYSSEAAENAGASETLIRHRIAEMHQLSFNVILKAIRALNAPAAYRFANGQVLMGEARLAFVMGDQPAQDKVIGKKSKSCRTLQVVFMHLR